MVDYFGQANELTAPLDPEAHLVVGSPFLANVLVDYGDRSGIVRNFVWFLPLVSSRDNVLFRNLDLGQTLSLLSWN